jgi:hypothetical protein
LFILNGRLVDDVMMATDLTAATTQPDEQAAESDHIPSS